jgi:hypothetical protein
MSALLHPGELQAERDEPPIIRKSQPRNASARAAHPARGRHAGRWVVVGSCSTREAL